MKIIIRTKNIKLDSVLKLYIDKRLNSLERFAKEFWGGADDFFGKGKPKIEAWMEIGKDNRHHQKGEVFFAECQMKFPGKSVRTTATGKTLRIAVTQLKDELQRELKEYKEKISSSTKRKQRVLKKSLHLSSQARFWRKGRILEEGV